MGPFSPWNLLLYWISNLWSCTIGTSCPIRPSWMVNFAQAASIQKSLDIHHTFGLQMVPQQPLYIPSGGWFLLRPPKKLRDPLDLWSPSRLQAMKSHEATTAARAGFRWKRGVFRKPIIRVTWWGWNGIYNQQDHFLSRKNGYSWKNGQSTSENNDHAWDFELWNFHTNPAVKVGLCPLAGQGWIASIQWESWIRQDFSGQKMDRWVYQWIVYS